MGNLLEVEQQAMHDFTEKAYLNYAMYVIIIIYSEVHSIRPQLLRN